ncbi:melanoma-associated antigen B2 isoform X2 [Drosophila eugracilis]|uniref:melanoma-associated antigen B2 isoform X2 n=1 Tax=Drosophila eugracilis TaxID=29029 RepID=UPI0007E7B555|nr:melanoma-associated antigen B2 isoform X2 [Drosophila eugracilis]
MASTSRASRSQNVNLSQASQQPVQELDDKVRAIINYILDHIAQKIPIKDKDLVPAAGDRNELKKRLPLVTKLLAKRFEEPLASIHELTPEQRPQFTLLYIILMYIFLRGNRIEDSKLWGMLEMLNIQADEEHGYFGPNLHKLIEETFVKQQYLKRERSQLSAYDDPKTFFLWGVRAKAEFTYEQIVQFASKLLNQHPKMFDHYLAMAQEGANAEQ